MIMCSYQITKKVFISIFTLVIIIFYYSTYRHPYDLKLALTHHFYHKHPNHLNTYTQLNTTLHNYSINKANYPIRIENNTFLSDDFSQVFNITNIQLKQLSLIIFSLLNFQLLQLTHNHKKCPPIDQKFQSSFLLINTNTKQIGLKYMKLIKTLISKHKYLMNENEQQPRCLDFRIFLLREINILTLDSQQQTNQYVNQISNAIKVVSEKTIRKVSILTTEEGSAFLLKSFIDMIDTGEFKTQVYKKLDKILLVNLYNRNMVHGEAICEYLDEMKRSIISSKEKLKIFNSLNLVFINTLEKQYRLLSKINSHIIKYQNSSLSSLQNEQENYQNENNIEKFNSIISHSYFVFQKNKHWLIPPRNGGIQLIQKNQHSQQRDNTNNDLYQNSLQSLNYLSLQNSTFLHTMQMSNIHASFPNGDYFHFVPFLQLLSNFIIENSQSSMNLKAVQLYFRYGQTHNKKFLQLFNQIDINSCVLYNINTTCNFLFKLEPILWINNKKCFKLNLTTSIPNHVHLIYSEKAPFHIFTESMIQIVPFDKELNKSLYIFEKLQQNIIIYNPQNVKIIITIGQIITPSNPLTNHFTQSQILYLGQHNQQHFFSKKFIIRTCQSDNLLIFPDNFAVGKISREFLLQESGETCYDEENSYQKFMNKLEQNWILMRNIVIIILLKKSFMSFKSIMNNIVITFSSISMLLYYTQLTGCHVILILFTVFVINQGFQFVCQLQQYIQIDRTKVFLSMMILFTVSYVCQSFLFQNYNYWKILLIFLIFFINKDNALILGVKLFYLQDSILYGHEDFMEIIQLALFMYLTRTVKNKILVRFDEFWWVCKFFLILGLGFLIIFYPEANYFHSAFNCYIKIIIILNGLKTYLHFTGSNLVTEQKNS